MGSHGHLLTSNPPWAAGQAVPTWAGLAHPPIPVARVQPLNPRHLQADGERGAGRKSGSIGENRGVHSRQRRPGAGLGNSPSHFFPSPGRPGRLVCGVPGCLRCPSLRSPRNFCPSASAPELTVGCGDGWAPLQACSVVLSPFIPAFPHDPKWLDGSDCRWLWTAVIQLGHSSLSLQPPTRP